MKPFDRPFDNADVPKPCYPPAELVTLLLAEGTELFPGGEAVDISSKRVLVLDVHEFPSGEGQELGAAVGVRGTL